MPNMGHVLFIVAVLYTAWAYYEEFKKTKPRRRFLMRGKLRIISGGKPPEAPPKRPSAS